MKFPETAEDVKQEILRSSDKARELGDLRIRQLIHILPNVPPELVVEGVIRVFEDESRPETRFQDQKFAGKVLERIHPVSEKDLKDVLLRILKNWNKSVEQFPFWLRRNYGTGLLKDVFADLELNPREQDKLKTIKWWLQLDKADTWY
jgi:hypothetical protein